MVDVENIKKVIYNELDIEIDPSAMTKKLIDIVKGKGVQVIENCSVIKMHRQNSSVTTVTTNTGNEIKPETVFMCAGAWNRQLLGNFSVNLPGYVLPFQYYKSGEDSGLNTKVVMLFMLIFRKEHS